MRIAIRADVDINDTNIDQTEAGIDVWDSGTDYVLKDVVQVNGTTNRIYQAVQDAPAGNDPVADVNPETGIGTYWFDRGATNYMRAFDELSSSKCSHDDSIYYKFNISDMDTLMIDGIRNAATIRVIVKDAANDDAVRMDKTFDIRIRSVYDWFDWTFIPNECERNFYLHLPVIYNSTLEVYIDNDSNNIEAGHIAFGRSMNFGLSLIDPSPTVSMRGTSSKSRDDFGNIKTRRKARYKRMSITCAVTTRAVDLIEERLNWLADQPAIFIGDERDGGHRALLLYGELKDHDMPISAVMSKYKLDVEGYL